MKKFSSFSKMLLISIIAIIGLNPQLTVKSQSNKPNNQKVRFVQPILPRLPNRGAPTDRRGAGTRGECPVVSKAPTGLVPIVKSSNNSQFVIGNTVTEYPTFWFYIPYNVKSIHSVKFAVVSEKDQFITKEPIPVNISGTPGIISFTLPKTEQPLRAGEYYYWYLLIDCKPQSRSEDVAIEGLVQLVPPDAEFKKRETVATEREKVILYAQQGYWHDAITSLGEIRRKRPNDTTLIEDWEELLNSVNLTSVAAEPISPCCKAK